ncbi:hypothetical protein J3R82DRAFT_6776 [Butyriboletus roseoflavus]|nr:hypothetical protein J3R82DRAFT_6776 [Butyriboletus roseoflavus]
MRPSPSSPLQTPVTTLDEPHTRSNKLPLHTCTINSAEHATRPQPDSPSSSSQPPAPPTPASSSRHSAVSTSTSMSAIQSKVQPNSPSQNLSTSSISINSNPCCLILPEPAASLQRDHSVKVSSQPLDSGIVDPASLSTKSRQSITPSFSFPGASSSATTYDHLFPDSADSYCTSATASSTESISTTSQLAPNVYINGLPPHCSEQDLFALARPFGDIKSVRTFTRHVSEKPTGYGFVLFSDVDSAERCIDGLRKYRNLHPSFSKQVHRIPGTEYAQHNAAQSTEQDESTFKSRMEKLRDTASTNLYIEGLPLSIDEKSLADLMLPYKIKSSRFFKTKLSNPPRIIAFVRLETRTAAEETIERLHGRMVRGWNDPGCRISVRFADSAEQRELRRTERTLKNGDQSPSRLTIARAALLNLRGQELQTNVCDVTRGKPQRFANSRLDNQASFNPSFDSALLPTSRSLPSKLCYTYRKSPLPSTSDLPITSEMDTLLRSIQNMGYDDGSLDSTMRNLAIDNEYLMAQQAQLRLSSGALLSPNPVPITLPRGHAQARNGFTPAEELILGAHAQRLQLQAQISQSSSIFEPISSLRKLNADVRSFDHASHGPLQGSGLAGKQMFSQDTLPLISEDDFHAMGHPPRSFAPTSREFQGPVDSCPPNVPAATSTIFVRPPSRAVSIVPPPPDYEEPGKRPKGHHQRAERSTRSKQIPCPSSFNNHQSIPSGESNSHSSLLHASTGPNNISSNNDNNSNTSTIPCEKNIELQHTYMYSHGEARSCPEEDKGSRFRSLPASHTYTKRSPPLGEQHSTIREGPKSPAVISPALTYSSRTPSTLSPATPFFGSFAGSQDAFEVMTMENEDVAERKLKARVTNNWRQDGFVFLVASFYTSTLLIRRSFSHHSLCTPSPSSFIAMFSPRILAVATFVAVASAQLTITNPSPSSWWVSGTDNTLAWTCNTSPYSAYTVVLSNSDTTILVAPLALIADVPNYDCSFTVNPQQSTQPASSTYTLSFANIVNSSQVYASTQFEIKAAGSPYPASSASGTATSSGASASSTSTSKTGAAYANYIPVGMSMAAALVLGLVVA